jgi:hypothetical protein
MENHIERTAADNRSLFGRSSLDERLSINTTDFVPPPYGLCDVNPPPVTYVEGDSQEDTVHVFRRVSRGRVFRNSIAQVLTRITGLGKHDQPVSTKACNFPPETTTPLEEPPIRNTYLRGVLQADVDVKAPTIRIGITFLEGVDQSTVVHAEMNRETRGILCQQTPEWRVATASTLLKRFEVLDDFGICRPDDSHRILETYKVNEPLRKKLPFPPPSDQEIPQPLGETHSSPDPSQQAKHDMQDSPLSIDSESVHLIHRESIVDCEYDILCTLIEIDLESMRKLVLKIWDFFHDDLHDVSEQHVMMTLDTLITDVRRLYLKSPTLFRMGTRSIIARSKNTRYGVNYKDHVFATITTSQGIRIFIERSIAYYRLLNNSLTDQEIVRPMFLQMLVMMLSLLNDDDLKQLSNILEDTFKIPSNRLDLEILILKVLPLSSINSEIFMRDLLYALDTSIRVTEVEDRMTQQYRWRRLQKQLARDGYILPVQIRPRVFPEDSLGERLDDFMNAMEHESWLPAWPDDDGILDSTIFKHIQHFGDTKQQGNIQQDTVKAVNIVPHLHITSEDRENEYVAVCPNGARYRVSADDLEHISAMKTMRYTLKEVDQDTIVELDIAEDVLNQPFIEAAKQNNQLADWINLFLGGQRKKLSLFTRNSTIVARIEEPVLATRVWAELISPSGQRSRVAEAFKLGDRIVFQDDIVKSMNGTLSRLNRNVERIQREVLLHKVKDDDNEITKKQAAHVSKKVLEALDVIKILTADAGARKTDLVKLNSPALPTNPISRVIYKSFIQTSDKKPEWQAYASRLHADQKRLFVRSKRLVVDEVHLENIIKLEFHSACLIISVQPLTPSAEDGDEQNFMPLEKGATILWLGYYIVHVDPVPSMKNNFEVLAYYRVLSQKREGMVQKSRNPADAFQGSFLI